MTHETVSDGVLIDLIRQSGENRNINAYWRNMELALRELAERREDAMSESNEQAKAEATAIEAAFKAPFERASVYAVFPFKFEGQNGDCHYHGIGKRELFAAMAMQGFCSLQEIGDISPAAIIAAMAAEQADALLAELEKTS